MAFANTQPSTLKRQGHAPVSAHCATPLWPPRACSSPPQEEPPTAWRPTPPLQCRCLWQVGYWRRGGAPPSCPGHPPNIPKHESKSTPAHFANAVLVGTVIHAAAGRRHALDCSFTAEVTNRLGPLVGEYLRKASQSTGACAAACICRCICHRADAK